MLEITSTLFRLIFGYKITRRIISIPYSFLVFILAISIIGIILLYSAGGGDFSVWASKELVRLTAGLLIMVFITLLDIKFLFSISYLIYLIALSLLLLVEVIGHSAMGATRWVDLFFIKIQPSEIMKLAIIFALARYFHGRDLKDLSSIKELIIPIILVALPTILIIRQPDLGTAGILLIISVTIFFITGVNIWFFAICSILFISSVPILWHFLHEYQKDRILTFLNPELDPTGSSYNIIQSKIAIGSGGMWGKGLTNGSQSQLDFLPEHQTDFIFTMAAEELGFAGSSFIIILYIITMLYMFIMAFAARNKFAKLLAIGSVSLFTSHVLINIAMVSGLIPIVGVPLPLISYGGTIMVVVMACFGLVINSYINQSSYLASGRDSFL